MGLFVRKMGYAEVGENFVRPLGPVPVSPPYLFPAKPLSILALFNPQGEHTSKPSTTYTVTSATRRTVLALSLLPASTLSGCAKAKRPL